MPAERISCHVCKQPVYRINGRIGMHTRRAGGVDEKSGQKPQHELCPGSK